MGRVVFARLGGASLATLVWRVGLVLAVSSVSCLGPPGVRALAGQTTQVVAPDTPAPARTVGLVGARPPEPDANGRLPYHVRRTATPVEVDGHLDDAAWRDAVVVPLPFEVAPADNAAAPVATECRLAYDDEHVYLGCIARDPRPEEIRAYVVDRDAIDGHDRIVLTLDPFGDQRRAFEFSVSPLGVQADAVLAQQSTGDPNQPADAAGADPSWDAIWSSAGTLTDGGYVVEAAIPFRSLRFPSTDAEMSWGGYVTRWWPRSSNVEIRSASLDRADACGLCQANVLHGIQGVRPGVNVQLTPTLTGSRLSDRPGGPGSPLRRHDPEGELGLDAQWGVTSDLTLNLTANPDFSQVEADVAQIEANQRFALFFPERRPFFLEGADFFGTPIRAVFTRSIVDPVAGAKLTGKLGDHAVGALVAHDRSPGLLIPGPQFSSVAGLDGDVTTSVARLRRDLGASSTVGAIFTGREGDGYHNRVAGVDALYRPVPSVTLESQILRSSTRYPAAVASAHDQTTGAFGGVAARLNGRWETRNWSLFTNGNVTGSGFRADAGFQTRAGYRGLQLNGVRRVWGGADRWFSQLRFEAGTWHFSDLEGTTLNGGIWFGLTYQGPWQSRVSVWPNLLMREHFAGVTYDGISQYYFETSVSPNGAVTLGLNGDVGDVVDFANARLARQLRLSPLIELRLGRNTQATLRHTVQRLRRDGGTPFTVNLSEVRGVYNFSARSYLRAIVQLRRTDRDPSLHAATVDRRSTGVVSQLLYAYKVNPRTVFFLGYGEDGVGSIDEGRRRTPLTTRSRTFFLKLGWAWRP